MELDTREKLVVHIEGLQATLAKRNERIAELEKELTEQGKSKSIERAEKKAYKQGWRDCSSHLMETTRVLALELNKVRKDSFDLYLKSDKLPLS